MHTARERGGRQGRKRGHCSIGACFAAEAEAEDRPDPADELRAKLEESRAAADDRQAFEAGETPIDEADPEARRARVHEQGRARLDELSKREE